MKLGGIAAAAIEVLVSAKDLKLPATQVLKQWGRSHRFAGSGDRAIIANLVFDALRQRSLMTWLIDDDSSRGIIIATLAHQWRFSVDEIVNCFTHDRYAPPQLTPHEITNLNKRKPEQAADEIRCCLPSWLIPKFVNAFGDHWLEEAIFLSVRAPIDLRVNGLKATTAKVIKALARFEPQIIADKTIRIGNSANLTRSVNLSSTPQLQRGWFEIQDWGSQIAARLCACKNGLNVLDYCAGAGGKTLALADMMAGRGQVFAHDAFADRLVPLYPRLKRSGAHNVQIVETAALSELTGRMDRVVVDAPCSGSGTWRRRPDAKWRLSEKELNRRCTDQENIIRQAKEFVKVGGYMIYITCSLFDEENKLQIEKFIAEDDRFCLVEVPDWLEKSALTTQPFEQLIKHGLIGQGDNDKKPAGWLLDPVKVGCDGFYIAVAQRQR